jgi:hypothetical protein
VPYEQKPLKLAELAMKEAGYHRTRIPGQQLKGVMIPTVSRSAPSVTVLFLADFGDISQQCGNTD